ncbi:MAG TPA: ABC transporter ATP-binding protein [Gaiellaceae bacterium]|nr:ABC transporter ATP-binding protein [Gaiellaceae bacterium]
MSDVAIIAEGLSKRYRLGQMQRVTTLRDLIADTAGAPFRAGLRLVRGADAVAEVLEPERRLWALKDVSFEVKRGEVVGVIGRNGSGKTTLLKLLSQITEPTEGYAAIHGRVGSLLEVGTGFHAELTGRENVFLNGAILGMRRSEIQAKFDDIVEFSGVAKFLDTPVKRYSSGMQVRLAFAVAAHLEPEILLVDEVLAVGDAAFQRKCLGKMESVATEGRTVFLVSHNMEAITNLCTRVIWIDNGGLRADGDPHRTVRDYLATTRSEIGTTSLADRNDRTGPGPIRFTSIEIRNAAGEPTDAVDSGETVEFVVSYTTNGERLQNVSPFIYVHDQFDRPLLVFWSQLTAEDFSTLPPEGRIVCQVPRFPLTAGTYAIDVGATVNSPTVRDGGDEVKNAAMFEVVTGDFFGTGRSAPSPIEFQCPHSWTSEAA